MTQPMQVREEGLLVPDTEGTKVTPAASSREIRDLLQAGLSPAEVDLPIAEVSKHAAREKSIRHGHPSALHLWWARRPLASSRADLMALLLPDPCDDRCPEELTKQAPEILGHRPGQRPAQASRLRGGLRAPLESGSDISSIMLLIAYPGAFSMPTVLRIGRFRFHFYSDEGREPPHIHVAIADSECKFWLNPVRLGRNKGVAPHVIRKMERLVFQHAELLLEKYHEYHNP